MKTALLLSGGMDSTAIAYWLRPDVAVTIDYGQRPAAGEIRAAEAVTKTLGIKHYIVSVDINALGSGDLAGRDPIATASVSEWWPYRNQMLVTLAAMRLASENIDTLYIGTIANDCVHIDGQLDFVTRLDALMKLQEGHLSVQAPAIQFDTATLCRKSEIPIEILSWAHSCHKSDFACGMCRGCKKHYETLKQLGRTPY